MRRSTRVGHHQHKSLLVHLLDTQTLLISWCVKESYGYKMIHEFILSCGQQRRLHLYKTNDKSCFNYTMVYTSFTKNKDIDEQKLPSFSYLLVLFIALLGTEQRRRMPLGLRRKATMDGNEIDRLQQGEMRGEYTDDVVRDRG